MSHRKNHSFASLLLEALQTLTFLVIQLIAWLIRVIPQIVYFFWSIWGYSKSEYFRVTHKSIFQLIFDKGAYGEYLIFRHLDKKIQGEHKWLFNIYLPRGQNRTTEIDVLLFHASGIYVFESKNYKGWIFGSENRRVWTQCIKPSENTRVKKYRFLNPIMQNKLHLTCLEKCIGENHPPIHSIILFGNRCNLKKIQLTSGKHTVIRLKELSMIAGSIINRIYNQGAESWEGLYVLLYPMTQVSDAVKRKHIDDINAEIRGESASCSPMEDISNISHQVESSLNIAPSKNTNQFSSEAEAETVSKNHQPITITNDICPQCGGTLVRRTVKKGPNQGKPFIGCSNFPKCRYTKQI